MAVASYICKLVSGTAVPIPTLPDESMHIPFVPPENEVPCISFNVLSLWSTPILACLGVPSTSVTISMIASSEALAVVVASLRIVSPVPA